MMRLSLMVQLVSASRVMQEHAEKSDASITMDSMMNGLEAAGLNGLEAAGFGMEAEVEAEAESGQPVVFNQAHPSLTASAGAVTGAGRMNWNKPANSALQVNEGDAICGISFKCNTAASHLMIGLSSRTVRGWTDLDFGVTCRGGWRPQLDIYESARPTHQLVRRNNGNFASDVHAIRINNGQVEFSLNGGVYYTSSASVSYPWHVGLDTYQSPSLSDVEYLPCNNYVFGQTGSNTCPGSDVSEADCLAATQSVLPSGQRQGRTHLSSGSWGWVPPGCSMQTHVTMGIQGDWGPHYNRNGNGNNDGGYTKVCAADVDGWTLVLQYGSTAYQPNTGSVGTLDEDQKQHAKLSDAAINALPSGGDAGYDYYKLSSESAGTGRDTILLRVQGAYNDRNPTLGFTSYEYCREETIDACTSWDVAAGGTLGIDTFYPCGQACNDCTRWFTGYGNRHLCYADRGSGGRCWTFGHCGSTGRYVLRQDVKMFKLTA